MIDPAWIPSHDRQRRIGGDGRVHRCWAHPHAGCRTPRCVQPAVKRRLRRKLLARDSAGLHARPHHHQPEQRRLLSEPARRARGAEALPGSSRIRRPCTTCGRSSSPTSRACAGSSASDFGCDPEELAITRNASEALQIAQLGIPLKAGDEVVTTNQDYGRMLDTWEQRVAPRRDHADEDFVSGTAEVDGGSRRSPARQCDHARRRKCCTSATSPT